MNTPCYDLILPTRFCALTELKPGKDQRPRRLLERKNASCSHTLGPARTVICIWQNRFLSRLQNNVKTRGWVRYTTWFDTLTTKNNRMQFYQNGKKAKKQKKHTHTHFIPTATATDTDNKNNNNNIRPPWCDRVYGGRLVACRHEKKNIYIHFFFSNFQIGTLS